MHRVPGGTRATAARQARQINLREFARGVWLELHRVTWPTREEWMSATALTIVLVVAIGIFTWVCDWVFGQIFNFIHPSVIIK